MTEEAPEGSTTSEPLVHRRSVHVAKYVVISASVFALVVASITARICFRDSFEHVTGVPALLLRVFDLLVAIIAIVVALGIGRSMAAVLKLHFNSTAEGVSFSLLLGTGFIGLSVLLLGLLGLLQPLFIIPLMIVYLGFSYMSLMRLYNNIVNAIANITATHDGRILSFFFLALVCLLALRTAIPPTNGDELIYHLPMAQQFVRQGRIFPSYDNSLGNVPFLIQMVYGLCLMLGSDIAPKYFSLLLTITTGFALYAFCTRFLTQVVGIVSLFSFFAAGMVVEVGITSRIDVSLAGMLFGATYAMMIYLNTKNRGWLWASALLSGFSLGIKHSAIIWVGLLGAMYLIREYRSGYREWLKVIIAGLIYSSIMIAVASPWYIKNAIWFNNPIYPFATGELAEFGPQGVRYFNGNDDLEIERHFQTAKERIPAETRSFSLELEREIESRPSRHPLRLWEFFTRPNNYLMAEPRHYPNYLFLVIPLLFFVSRNQLVCWLLFLATGYVVISTSTSWIARYLLPAYPGLTIVSSYVLVQLGVRVKRLKGPLRNFALYGTALGLSVSVGNSVASLQRANPWSFYLGRISRHQYQAPYAYFQQINFINSQLPLNARIMCLGAQLNYGIKRPYVADETWFATKWRRLLIHNPSLMGVRDDLKRQGFTHIYYSPGLFRFAAAQGSEGTGGLSLMSGHTNNLSEEARKLGSSYHLLRTWATFTLFRSEYLELLYRDETGFEVLRLK